MWELTGHCGDGVRDAVLSHLNQSPSVTSSPIGESASM